GRGKGVGGQSLSMPYDFLPHHNSFRAQVRSFVKQRLTPQSSSWETKGQFPSSILRLCATHGLISIDSERNAVVAEELPKSDCMGLALTVFVQANLVAPMLQRLGSKEQKRKLLPDLLVGKRVGAMAVSEPASGSDFAALKTRAESVRRGWRLSGVKTYITN